MASTTLKVFTLALLTLQNSAWSIILHQSRIPDLDGHLYSAPTVVLLSEASKVIVSLAALFFSSIHALSGRAKLGLWAAVPTSGEPGSGPSKMRILLAILGSPWIWLEGLKEVASLVVLTKEGLRLGIPATLFVVQNNLQLVGASHMDAPLFQTISQLKLVTTALFATWLLGKRLSLWQWLSICSLACGVAVAQSDSFGLANKTAGEEPSTVRQELSPLIGLLALLAACLISGFAGVYVELVLKTGADFWATNAQLSALSLVPALFPVVLDAVKLGAWGPLRHMGTLAWSVVILNTCGGLLVSLVIKVADNVSKGFAVALAIVLTFAVGAAFFDQPLRTGPMVGAGIVIASVIVYVSTPVQPKTDVCESQPMAELTATTSSPGPAFSDGEDEQSREEHASLHRPEDDGK